MSEQREIERVLAVLDSGTGTRAYGDAMGDAARVIREMARDFEAAAKYVAAVNNLAAMVGEYGHHKATWLDAARARWRLS